MLKSKYLDKVGLARVIENLRGEYNSLVWSGTRAEYEIAAAAGLIKEGAIINITDDPDLDIGEITKEQIDGLFAAN